MRRLIFPLLCCLLAGKAYGQITLEACQRKAQENYPLMKQYDLLEQSKSYTLENASKGYLPQFSLSGKATYQSAVTELPIRLPGVDIPALPKEQYQVLLELRQNLWDGGEIRKQREGARAASAVEREALHVEMYGLNERVDQLYFGTLILDEQLNQTRLLQEDLERNLERVKTYVANGVANKSDLDAIQVHLLELRQQQTERTSTRQAYLKMLSLLTGETLRADATLLKPAGTDASIENNPILRPELNWFAAQRHSLQVQEEGLTTRSLPKVGLFVQGGYGNPGLNMLKNAFTPFYIGGLRLSWNFGSLYTLRNEKRLLANNQLRVQNREELFLFNTKLLTTQQQQAIDALRKQMQDDEEIVQLRTNIRQAAEAKVANGTLTVTELLRELTAEQLARQTQALHEIQLLMQIRKLNYLTNH